MVIAQNPALSEISLVFAKNLKPLLDVTQFLDNVNKVIELVSQCN